MKKQIEKKYFLNKNFLYFSMKKVKNKVPVIIERPPKFRNRFLMLPFDQIKKGEMVILLE